MTSPKLMANQLRQWIKDLIPEKHRLLRYQLAEKLRYYPDILISLGNRLECPFCGWRFRRFLPAGFDYEVLKEKKVVGGPCHADDVCPRCLSNSRERLVLLFLRHKTTAFDVPTRMLHIAPEPNLGRRLRAQSNIQYFSADLFEPGVMARFDVMRMPFAEATFDAIICNHVLEHVADDTIAMGELFRILKPGGWAILQVPIALTLESTVEDPEAVSEEDRIRLFGQRDHVRLYASPDYMGRLGDAGFHVSEVDFSRELTPGWAAKYALLAEETVFLCSKPASIAPSAKNPS